MRLMNILMRICQPCSVIPTTLNNRPWERSQTTTKFSEYWPPSKFRPPKFLFVSSIRPSIVYGNDRICILVLWVHSEYRKRVYRWDSCLHCWPDLDIIYSVIMCNVIFVVNFVGMWHWLVTNPSRISISPAQNKAFWCQCAPFSSISL